MKVDWSLLRQELAAVRRAGLELPLWWRDDDAIAPTEHLARLADLSAHLDLPVHVAIIPRNADPVLPEYLKSHTQLIPVVHGWQHQSHAQQGAKKSEFGQARPLATAQLHSALVEMKRLFGPALVPLFVPPWNRISDTLLPALPRLGYTGVSTYGPRPAPTAYEGLVQVNTHIDPIFWKGDRGLVPPETLVARLVALLKDRRERRTDATEPLGLLTHHLVHTEEVWQFAEALVKVLLDGGAVPANLLLVPHAIRNPKI